MQKLLILFQIHIYITFCFRLINIFYFHCISPYLLFFLNLINSSFIYFIYYVFVHNYAVSSNPAHGVSVKVMVLNTTFNNISAISWWSVLLVEETGGPWENHDLPQVTNIIYHIMFWWVHLTMSGIWTHSIIMDKNINISLVPSWQRSYDIRIYIYPCN
jgi:hypothetical protein